MVVTIQGGYVAPVSTPDPRRILEDVARLEPKKLFTVQPRGAEAETVRGRLNAVELAKDLSEPHREVSVEREDGEVSMRFYSGALEFLHVDTRKRGRRRRKK